MKLKEAIRKASLASKNLKINKAKRQEQKQLAIWLEELRESRKIIKELRGVIDRNKILTKPIWDTLAEMGIIA